LKIVKAEIKYSAEDLGVDVIGWCTDDGGDARAMRKKLHAEAEWIITVACWTHQVRSCRPN
jgi:epoxyqueuosine reductase QueG